MGRCREWGLLDKGSEIVIVQEDLCKELGLEVNKKRRITMQTADGGKEEMQGCVEYLELEVGGVKTYAHAFVVQSAPYQLLLGRPWQKGVKLGKIERVDGSVEVEILDPKEEMRRVVVLTRERIGERLKGSMLAVEERSGSEKERFKLNEEPSRSGYGEEAKALFTGVNMGVGTGRRASGATIDVLKTELERDSVKREEVEEWVDAVIGYRIGMASWLEEGSKKMAMNEGGDVQCDEEVILEESEEETEHGVDRIVGSGVTATSRLVEEKEMGIPDPREDARRDKDIVLKRKRDRPRDMEEVRQRGVKERDRVVRDSVWVADQQVEEKEIGIPNAERHVQCDEDIVSERKGEEDMLREEKGMSKILKELTKKDGTLPWSSQEQAIEIEEELESQLLGNFVKCMATPPGIPAISSLVSTEHAHSCYSTTITASRGYHERRGCDGGTMILISMSSSSSVGCSPSITTTMTEDSCPLKEKSQASRDRREESAHLPAGPTSQNIGGSVKKLQAVELSSALSLNGNLVNGSKS